MKDRAALIMDTRARAQAMRDVWDAKTLASRIMFVNQVINMRKTAPDQRNRNARCAEVAVAVVRAMSSVSGYPVRDLYRQHYALLRRTLPT